MSRHAQAGQTLPFVAVVIGALLGFTGLAVDAGYLRYEQRIQQTAADSAAIAGASELLAGTNITTAAKNDAASNGFTDNGASTIVTVNNPPSAVAGDPYNSNAGAVEVLVRVAQPSFFMKAFGFRTTPEVTRAIAASTANDDGCLYTLDPNANTNFNTVTTSASGCAMNFDGSVNFHGATLSALSVGCATTCSNASGVTPQPVSIVPASDPCMQIAGCASLTTNPPSTTPCASTYKKGAAVAYPGCYSSMTFGKGTTVALQPGLYVVNGPANWNNATITGSGVTIYITANGSLSAQSSAINLSACTTTLTPAIACTAGAVNNMLLYQIPGNTNVLNFNGSTETLAGVVYAPSVDGVNFNKTGSGYAVIIVGAANFNGSTNTYTPPPAGESYIRSVVLVE
jgi:hypothetical protein